MRRGHLRPPTTLAIQNGNETGMRLDRGGHPNQSSPTAQGPLGLYRAKPSPTVIHICQFALNNQGYSYGQIHNQQCIVMIIDFHKSGATNCPLIRIYGTSTEEFSELFRSVEKLALGTATSIPVEKLPGFHGVDGCSLALVATAHDGGCAELTKEHPDAFELKLTRPKWGVVAVLIEPFTLPPLGSYHQWLCGREAIGDLSKSEIAIVLSSGPDGAW
jgi:hypothetical protein